MESPAGIGLARAFVPGGETRDLSANIRRENHPLRIVRSLLLGSFVSAALLPQRADAFWLLGFSTADTLPRGELGAIAGTGGQYSSVGDPRSDSFTPFLPHAGLRVGVADGWDVGYRLTQVALPYSSAGPSLGGEVDVKHRLTSPESAWQSALVLGVAYSYLDLESRSKSAWSPGVDWVVSRPVGHDLTAISELRYVYTAIPAGPGGEQANHVSATGIDFGLRIGVKAKVSIIPEIGLFDFSGRLAGRNGSGFAAQYGVVLAFRF